jgi:midasin (ATPase involved in ribosome maturation)
VFNLTLLSGPPWACRCVDHCEPVLLVGETGVGKTTVCQLLALMRGQRLHVLNCNQHTETADFLGGFRWAPCSLEHSHGCTL